MVGWDIPSAERLQYRKARHPRGGGVLLRRTRRAARGAKFCWFLSSHWMRAAMMLRVLVHQVVKSSPSSQATSAALRSAALSGLQHRGTDRQGSGGSPIRSAHHRDEDFALDADRTFPGKYVLQMAVADDLALHDTLGFDRGIEQVVHGLATPMSLPLSFASYVSSPPSRSLMPCSASSPPGQ